MATDFTSILACLTGFEDHHAKRWAGRLHRLPCASEEGFLLAVIAMMATPDVPITGAWSDLDPIRQEIAQRLRQRVLIQPRSEPLGYQVYGAGGIDASAHKQMNDVMSLAPVVAGALMPDAHVGYGMPIGGVAAVENAVIPYAVGVDIGCRMHLTVFREPTADLGRLRAKLREAILKGTHFGRA